MHIVRLAPSFRRPISPSPACRAGWLPALLLWLGGSAAGLAATGIPWIDSNTNLTLYGDVRLRYEVDWDSQNAAGVPRDDRNRGRFRGRFGAGYQLAPEWSIGARVRTGDSDSQQSPHLTFTTDDGENDDLSFVADRYFLQYKRGPAYVWGGRNLLPFWYQNELFWDEDVTPTGVGGAYDHALGKGRLTAAAGGFFLPDGAWNLNGQMLAGQVKWTSPVKPGQLTVATGLNGLFGDDGAEYLRNRNGARDYLISVTSAQWTVPWGKVPVTLGADLLYNFLDYDAADVAPFPADTTDERLGCVFSVLFGQLKERHDWLAGYFYAHIETFAVNASYAQDDWIRFGSGPQTDASDFEGHEFRLAYAISKQLNVVARLYLVEAITTVQDGNRFRIDLNWRF
jgi:hypothetical protein